jgi:hypothetical protein
MMILRSTEQISFNLELMIRDGGGGGRGWAVLSMAISPLLKILYTIVYIWAKIIKNFFLKK